MVESLFGPHLSCCPFLMSHFSNRVLLFSLFVKKADVVKTQASVVEILSSSQNQQPLSLLGTIRQISLVQNSSFSKASFLVCPLSLTSFSALTRLSHEVVHRLLISCR